MQSTMQRLLQIARPLFLIAIETQRKKDFLHNTKSTNAAKNVLDPFS